MKHFATPDFWDTFARLPLPVQRLARKKFELLRTSPRHPSLHLKKAGDYWSARVGLRYRTLGVDVDGGILWFWIGSHADYDRLLERQGR